MTETSESNSGSSEIALTCSTMKAGELAAIFLIFAVVAQIRLDVEEKREKRESHMHLTNDRDETTRIM